MKKPTLTHCFSIKKSLRILILASITSLLLSPQAIAQPIMHLFYRHVNIPELLQPLNTSNEALHFMLFFSSTIILLLLTEKRKKATIFLSLVFIVTTTEFIQQFIPERAFSMNDLLANILGIGFALALIQPIKQRKRIVSL